MHKVDGTLALLQTNSANDKRLQHRYQMLKASCQTELLNDSINCRVYWDRTFESSRQNFWTIQSTAGFIGIVAVYIVLIVHTILLKHLNLCKIKEVTHQFHENDV